MDFSAGFLGVFFAETVLSSSSCLITGCSEIATFLGVSLLLLLLLLAFAFAFFLSGAASTSFSGACSDLGCFCRGGDTVDFRGVLPPATAAGFLSSSDTTTAAASEPARSAAFALGFDIDLPPFCGAAAGGAEGVNFFVRGDAMTPSSVFASADAEDGRCALLSPPCCCFCCGLLL